MAGRTPWRTVAIVAGVSVLAAVLRFSGLGRLALWSDEAFVMMATAQPWGVLLLVPFDVHPPLFLALQKLTAVAGDSAAALRAPAALYGVLVIPVVAALGAALGGRTAGVVAALVVALSTAHLYYSQEARSYTLLVLLLATAVLGAVRFLRAGEAGGTRFPWLYAAAAVLALYTHAIAVFYIAAIAAGGMLAARPSPKRQALPRRPWVIANLSVALMWLPWLAVSAQGAATFQNIAPTAPSQLIWYLGNVLGAPALPFGAWNKLLELAVMLASLAGGGVLLRRRDRAGTPIVAMFVLAPLLMLLAGVSKPVIETKTLLPLIVPAAVLIGVAVASLRTRAGRFAGAGLLVALLGTSALLARGALTKPNDPARIARNLSGAGAEAAVLLCLPFSAPALARELPGRPLYFVEQPGDGPPLVIRYSPELWYEIYRLPFHESWALDWSAPWRAQLSDTLGEGFAEDAATFLARHETVHHVAMTCSDEARMALKAALERAGWQETGHWSAAAEQPPPVFLGRDWSEVRTFTRGRGF